MISAVDIKRACSSGRGLFEQTGRSAGRIQSAQVGASLEQEWKGRQTCWSGALVPAQPGDEQVLRVSSAGEPAKTQHRACHGRACCRSRAGLSPIRPRQ